MTDIRTRFAPSPTGELHIGGARTALFNYLLAKKNKGKFVLRIEDTDIVRNKEEFINKQYQDLCWLGLRPDESIFWESGIDTGEKNHEYYGPYRQSQRLDIYQKYIQQLLTEKKAYYCFCSPVELAQEKIEYIKKNKRGNYQYSQKCLQLNEEKVISFLQEKKKHLIRYRVPQKKNYQFIDLVRGQITFPGSDIEDFVICRNNGIPLLNFAVVIDDHLMKISHVLRGEEHLSNTAKQLVLYETLGWSPPQFGHLSLILNQEKKKLSKRDKETSQWQLVSQLREKGYLPAAVINYLLFLGWHPGTTQEFFSLSTAIASFGLTSLHARGAVFDLGKLNWYNNYYIQQLSLVEFGEHAWKIFWKEYQLSQAKKEWTIQIALLFRPQLNYFQELITLSWYFFQEPREEKINLDFSELRKISQLFSKIEQWTEENVKKSLTSIEKNFFSSIRKKITGENRGPELAKVIYLLGKEELIKRLEN